jgi:alpha-ketoglutarate-dependent 2,4-dichlorophenoxyacetate dioxygenase
MQIHPLSPAFAAEAAGIDLREPLTDRQTAEIVGAMDRYAVLVFRDQPLDDAQQMAFARCFGPLQDERGGSILRDDQLRIDRVFADISNLDTDGAMLAADDRRRLFAAGNRLWHSDSSFRPVPPTYSILSARTVPARGGDTEFADMRAAYDALDADTRAEIEDLVVEHSLLYSRGLLGFTFSEEDRRAMLSARQRLVRTHQGSGRRSLYLSSHACAIEGWALPLARVFLRELTDHATQREFVHRHRWRCGDLVMWDNRVTMHRGCRYAEFDVVRDLRRLSIAGDRPTVSQPVATA